MVHGDGGIMLQRGVRVPRHTALVLLEEGLQLQLPVLLGHHAVDQGQVEAATAMALEGRKKKTTINHGNEITSNNKSNNTQKRKQTTTPAAVTLER